MKDVRRAASSGANPRESARTHSPDAQQRVAERASHLVLYHFEGCPYCARVRDAMHDLDLDIELRDIRVQRAFRDELLEGGGRATVPCLRIGNAAGGFRWLYESSDIVAYLRQRFSK
ncbi:MAG: glutathione S-transferase N-terminal domain-containing protein [Deltaproteobacteria bacterium]|nr:MAG: glutathione S-transferase N-terminal domain-containing protein [Deltaproteobacteria bacterium]